jgi:hypothetical protein
MGRPKNQDQRALSTPSVVTLPRVTPVVVLPSVPPPLAHLSGSVKVVASAPRWLCQPRKDDAKVGLSKATWRSSAIL